MLKPSRKGEGVLQVIPKREQRSSTLYPQSREVLVSTSSSCLMTPVANLTRRCLRRYLIPYSTKTCSIYARSFAPSPFEVKGCRTDQIMFVIEIHGSPFPKSVCCKLHATTDASFSPRRFAAGFPSKSLLVITCIIWSVHLLLRERFPALFA